MPKQDLDRQPEVSPPVGGKSRRASWFRHLFRPAQYLLDVSALVGAFVLAYLLRFDLQIPEDEQLYLLIRLPYVVFLQFAILFFLGVYKFVWRYIGMAEIKAFLKAAVLSTTPILMLRLWLPDDMHHWRVPLSIIVMDAVFAFGGVLALRVMRRALCEHSQRRRNGTEVVNGKRKSVLLAGAGHAGLMAVREIQGRPELDLEVKGFVDDDPVKQGAVIQGVEVLGSTLDLPRLVRELGIDHVVITIAMASRRDIRRIVDICEKIPVKVRIIPGLFEILQGNVQVSHIRDVQIEDLLGREAVHLDEKALGRFLVGKRVMVTGAGGSIGSELVRQVACLGPSSLILVERAEFALFDIDREVKDRWPDVTSVSLVADVGDGPRMRHILSTCRPQVIFHAAAHKQVPMMESNTGEAIKNNVLSTRLLGELAGEHGVETFVMISTDKAVRPTSAMGASKRMAELVVQDLDRRLPTRYVAVRFGNVMGSVGSVIPIFRKQIAKGGPVTVTHPDMTRYFMTIPEASQLVLQAGAMGEGGEIFILDMGQPVRILDLAVDMIRISGLRPYEDIDVVFTGVRPGEKLFEELETVGENIAKTRHPKVFIGKLAPYPAEKLERGLKRLGELVHDGNDDEIRVLLGELLPEANLSGASKAQEAAVGALVYDQPREEERRSPIPSQISFS